MIANGKASEQNFRCNDWVLHGEHKSAQIDSGLTDGSVRTTRPNLEHFKAGIPTDQGSTGDNGWDDTALLISENRSAVTS